MSEEIPAANAKGPGPIGWVFTSVIFALVIGLQVYSYLVPRKSAESYADVEQGLRMRVLARAASGSNSSLGGLSGSPKFSASLLRNLPSDRLAEKYYAASRYESGLSTGRAELQALARSNRASDRAFAEVYGSNRLTVQEANRLAALIPKEPFINQLGRIHALEKAGLTGVRAKELSTVRIQLFVAGYTFAGLGALLGIIVWLVYFACKLGGYLPWLGHPAGKLSKLGSDVFAVRTAQYLAAYVGVSVLVAPIHLPAEIASVAGVSLIVILLPLLARLPIAGHLLPMSKQGWVKDNLGKNIAWGVLAAAANAPFLIVLLLISNGVFKNLRVVEHPMTLVLQNNRDLMTILGALTAASILAPIFEETMFRGTLLPALANRLGSVWLAIVVSSLLFGAMHPTGIPSWLPLAGIGTTSCILTYQTKSLVPSMVMHAVHNCVTLLLVLALS